MNKKLSFISIPFILLILVSYCKEESSTKPPDPYGYTAPGQTNDGWETASITEYNFDMELITELADYINFGFYSNVHSLLIVKEGKLVFEEYWLGNRFNYSGSNHQGLYTEFDRNDIHNQASVTKSVASALVGIAMDKGYINSVNDKVYDYFPEYSGLVEGEKADMTLEHLLSMTAGFEWDEGEYPYSDSRNDLIQMWNVADPLRYLMAKPLIHSPGTYFYYNSGCTNILGEIIYKASGIKADDFAKLFLFGPLDINSYSWESFSNGVVFVSGDLRIRPRDMAKIGYLYLSNGEWNGTRIVSAEWVNNSTNEYIALNNYLGYGYQWWLETHYIGSETVESFSARGWGGQRIMVFRELDMVVVFTGGNYVDYEPVDEIIYNYILPALI